jgi:2-dehydro-3-deoxyphosphogalactonate aldolase
MPHGDPEVIRAAKAAGLLCTPGHQHARPRASRRSPPERTALKLFPAELLGPKVPEGDALGLPGGNAVPAGGRHRAGQHDALRRGGRGRLSASGFAPLQAWRGTAEEVGRNARAFVAAWRPAEDTP